MSDSKKTPGRDLFPMTGKIVLVSGSSRGIGQSIAQEFLNRGAVVYITGLDPDLLSSVVLKLHGSYADHVRSYAGDLTRTEIIHDLVNTIIEREGHLDIVVANIGSGRTKAGWDIEDSAWVGCMERNFFAAVRLSRECLKVMIPKRKGIILFISSIAGCEVIQAPPPYAAAKAALLTYMKYTAHLVGADGIRINAISPGNVLFQGGTWGKKLSESPEAVMKYINENVPLKKFACPDDIAGLACFLASDDASFITGANFIIDGGQKKCVSGSLVTYGIGT